MAREIINVGSAPNDGTGDPLRTAYIKTNNNFGELYSRAQTNPPGSLIGSLGDVAGMYAYDQNYFYYCYADFDGSSQIWNQVSQIGNVSVTQLASGTSSVAIPNPNGNVELNVGGSGIGVVSSNGLEVTGNLTTSVNVSGGNLYSAGLISAIGTITGNFFVGNGAFLTGITTTYGNSNVASYLPTYSGSFPNLSGNVVTVGNIQGAYILGNGSQLTGLPANYGNSNVATFLTTYTGNISSGNVSATGNVQAAYFLGDGSLLTGIPASYSNANVALYLESYTGNVAAGNVIASGNISAPNVLQNGVRAYKYTTSNTAPADPVAGDNWWYTAGNVLYQYINDGTSSQWVDVFDPAFPPASTTATANTIVQRDENSSISGNVIIATAVSATGNIEGSYFIGNGSQLVGVPTSSARGFNSANTDISGNIVITHGLNVYPSEVYCQLRQANAYILAVSAVDSTTFTVTVLNSTDATAVGNSQVLFNWQVDL